MKIGSSDKWLSILAIIASVGTLFTVVYQTNLIRKQQYASVLPYLEIWNSQKSDSYRLILVNNGIGPAFIEDVKIVYLDSVYQMDPAEFLSQEINKSDSIRGFSYSNIKKGRIIPSGTQIELLKKSGDPKEVKRLWSWFSGNDPERKEVPEIEIEYSSVYGEKWKSTHFRLDQPLKLD